MSREDGRNKKQKGIDMGEGSGTPICAGGKVPQEGARKSLKFLPHVFHRCMVDLHRGKDYNSCAAFYFRNSCSEEQAAAFNSQTCKYKFYLSFHLGAVIPWARHPAPGCAIWLFLQTMSKYCVQTQVIGEVSPEHAGDDGFDVPRHVVVQGFLVLGEGEDVEHKLGQLIGLVCEEYRKTTVDVGSFLKRMSDKFQILPTDDTCILGSMHVKSQRNVAQLPRSDGWCTGYAIIGGLTFRFRT